MICIMVSRFHKFYSYIKSYKKWIHKGGFVVLDQGLFSGVNFLINVLLARWLPVEEYGAFVIAMAIFYLLAGFYNALLIEPMIVFGASKYRENLLEYLGILFWVHWIFSILISIGLAIIAWFFIQHNISICKSLLGLAIAIPFLFFMWFVRRIPYIQIQPHRAVMISGINFLLVLIVMFILKGFKIFSAVLSLLGIGVAGAVSSFLAFKSLLGINWQLGIATFRLFKSRDFIEEHWAYSKWALINVVVVWLVGNINYLLLGAHSLRLSAALRALHNLILPMQQILLAFSWLILPIFANAVVDNKTFQYKVKTSLRIILLLALLYIIILILGNNLIIDILYGSKYNDYAKLIPLYVTILIPSAINITFAKALKAKKKTYYIFIAYLIAACILLFIGFPFIHFFSILGAILMNIIASVVTAILLIYFYKISIRKKS